MAENGGYEHHNDIQVFIIIIWNMSKFFPWVSTWNVLWIHDKVTDCVTIAFLLNA